MKSYNDNYLQGQLVIATPNLVGSCFEKSVVYICSHDESGAMGLVVNNKLKDVTCSSVFAFRRTDSQDHLFNMPVYFGGPVDPSKGFILHTSDYKSDETINLDESFSLSSQEMVLQDMVSGKGPKDSIVALGYAGWGAGQLEEEIKNNVWINSSADQDLVFNTSNCDKWQEAAKKLGVNMTQYSHIAGNA